MTALNREQAQEVLARYGVTHPLNYAPLLAALEACVVPDPRIRVLGELCAEAEEWNASDKDTWFVITPERLRKVLRGED